jgi:hypothetical protein
MLQINLKPRVSNNTSSRSNSTSRCSATASKEVTSADAESASAKTVISTQYKQ